MSKRVFKRIVYVFFALCLLIPLFTLTSNAQSYEANIALEDQNMALDVDSNVNYYSTYRKFYNAEVGDNENVTFTRVVKQIERMYAEGFSRYEAGDDIKVYRVCFTNFYQYWYDYSGFLSTTKDNISSDRVTEIKALHDVIASNVEEYEMDIALTNIENLLSMLSSDATTLDNLGLYAAVIEKTKTQDTEVEKASYYLSYNKFIKAENPDGSKKISYAEVTKQIKNLLYEGINRYKSGSSYDDYYVCFSNSYGSWYETSGFERKTMAYISGARVTSVELQFATMKEAVRENRGVDTITTEVDKLISMLEVDAEKLDSLLGLTGEGGASSGLTIATFFGCFTIILREGLEAILIVGAIIAYLIKTGNKKQTKAVYIGAALAIVASALLALLLYSISLGGISTAVPQEIIEGATALIAVAVLIYVSNWMISKAESDAWTNYISGKVSSSSTKGNVFALAFTSFLAVFREGAEVILFYQPLVSSAKEIPNGWFAVFGGMGVGLLAVVLVFILIRVFSVKIPLKPFFIATSIFMALMSIVFLGAGIWELFIDGGIWPAGMIKGIESWAENEVLNFFGIYPTWLTIIPQIVLTIITVVTFILWIKKGKKGKKVESVEANNASTIEESNIDSASTEDETDTLTTSNLDEVDVEQSSEKDLSDDNEVSDDTSNE